MINSGFEHKPIPPTRKKMLTNLSQNELALGSELDF